MMQLIHGSQSSNQDSRKYSSLVFLLFFLVLVGDTKSFAQTQIFEDQTMLTVGGQTGGGHTLKNILIEKTQNIETWRFSLADSGGKAFSGPSAFHSLKWNVKTRQVEFNLSQVLGLQFTENRVADTFSRSRNIKNFKSFFDPFDQTIRLKFELKPGRNVKLKSSAAVDGYAVILLQFFN